MRTLVGVASTALIATCSLAGSALGGKPIDQHSNDQKQSNEQTVFVTGSLIPQRVKLRRIGTTTVSPIRIIDRRELDQTGRHSTRGGLSADPSVHSGY
jgi:hypothetical protein